MLPAVLIGAKTTDIGFEGLVLRKNAEMFKNVTVRTPNFEDILVHTILQNRENRRNG